jgi:glutamate synthase (NADPH/NADH) large chain
MSGGIAYVYDVKGVFKSLCNTEMVDLDEVGEADHAILHQMITKHHAYTKSNIARFVLDDFENQLRNFVKVFPRDYKKVLQARASSVKQTV